MSAPAATGPGPALPRRLPAGPRLPGRPAAAGAGRTAQAGRWLANTAVTLLLAAAAAALLFLGVGPRVLDYQTSTMLTGSMAPLINPGDVVVSVRTPASALKAGDIITYQIPVQDHRVETHRIAAVTRTSAGATVITTKGDANNGPDPWTAVITDDTVYTTAAVVPHLGDAIRALRSPTARAALLVGAPAVLLVGMLASIWHRPRPRPSVPAGSEAEGRDGR